MPAIGPDVGAGYAGDGVCGNLTIAAEAAPTVFRVVRTAHCALPGMLANLIVHQRTISQRNV
jgi:hypothetical protein